MNILSAILGITETLDPEVEATMLPDHDLLIEDILPSPLDDHSTFGIAVPEDSEIITNLF